MKISDLDMNLKENNPELELSIGRDVAYQIGHDIEFARALREISQKQLAELVGTKQSSISRIERGNGLPSLSFLQKIATALNTHLIPPRFELVEDFITSTEDLKTQISFESGERHEPSGYAQFSISNSREGSRAENMFAVV
jgi:transcriptional regulator with XRE-family HTH domain